MNFGWILVILMLIVAGVRFARPNKNVDPRKDKISLVIIGICGLIMIGSIVYAVLSLT